MKNVLVSIFCATYNHENYIEDALNSFLSQKTNFGFEILVHDDASNDNSTSILKYYEKTYDRVKVVYQTINQFSKGSKIYENLVKYARGDFIALCEGDDYWTDTQKLQKQIDFLVSNPEYSLCVHKASIINAKSKKIIGHIAPDKISRDLSLQEVILNDGSFFATNSMVFKKEGIINLPNFYFISPVGDYPLNINLALIGKIYYINQNMSVYRNLSKGSWTSSIQSNKKLQSDLYDKLINMLNSLDLYTDFNHSNTINSIISKYQCHYLFTQKKVAQARKTEYYQKLRPIKRLLIQLRYKNDFIYRALIRFRVILKRVGFL